VYREGGRDPPQKQVRLTANVCARVCVCVEGGSRTLHSGGERRSLMGSRTLQVGTAPGSTAGCWTRTSTSAVPALQSSSVTTRTAPATNSRVTSASLCGGAHTSHSSRSNDATRSGGWPDTHGTLLAITRNAAAAVDGILRWEGASRACLRQGKKPVTPASQLLQYCA